MQAILSVSQSGMGMCVSARLKIPCAPRRLLVAMGMMRGWGFDRLAGFFFQRK